MFLVLCEEVKFVYDVDFVIGRWILNLKKFGVLLFLLLVYYEFLCMSMSFNVVCDVVEEFELDNYKIKKGFWV